MTDDRDPLHPSALDKKLRVLSRDVYYGGQQIMEQGTQAHCAYYIESGRVEVSIKNPEGHSVTIATLGPGDVFGEMALITSEPRSATVSAIESTTVAVISKEDLERRLNNIDDQAIKALLHIIITRLRDANKGQLHHYSTLVDFQNRIAGMMEKATDEIAPERKEAFKNEIEPLLAQIESVLDKYR